MPDRKKKTAQPHALRYESTINKLEDLIKRIENNDISLEDSLLAFESGVKLTREAQTMLINAEQQVNLLLEDSGEILADPLGPEENSQ